MLLNKIRNIIEDSVKVPDRERSPNSYWPSQASAELVSGEIVGQCLRQAFYSIKGFPITNYPKIDILRKWEIGSAIEDYEIGLIEKAGLCISTQTPFKIHKPHYVISGKMDGICQIDNEIFGLEYKTSSGYYFRSTVFGTYRNPGFPKYPNLMQVMLYLDGFKEHKEYMFKKISLVYVDRDKGDDKEFVIELDNGFPIIDGKKFRIINISDIYDRFEILNEYVNKNILPPGDLSPMYNKSELAIQRMNYPKSKRTGDILCDFCKWKKTCMKSL